MAARRRYSDSELMTAIAAVAAAACPDEPESLSQPVFDSNRDTVADEYPDLPTARAIYMRLNTGNQGTVTWPSLVRGAVKGGLSSQQTVVTGRRSEAAVPVSAESIYFAMQFVARELDSRSPSPDQYDVKAEELRRTRRGALRKVLPTSAQMNQYTGGWDEVLALGGLESRAGTRSRARRPGGKSGSVPILDALGIFLEQQGWLPTQADLRWFAKDVGFALAGQTRELSWNSSVATFRRECAKKGRWCPKQPPPRPRPRSDPDPALLPKNLPVAVKRAGWAKEECVDAVVVFWDQLPAGEPLQKTYGVWASGKKYPAPSRFGEHGGFIAIRELARAKRRERDG